MPDWHTQKLPVVVRDNAKEWLIATPLFPEPDVLSTRPIGWLEPSVHYLFESTRPEAIAYREFVNRWYENFSDPSGAFGARLRSEVDVDHQQALDELFVHQRLRRRFNDVRYEEGGTGPDFRVYENDKCVVAIEVLSLFQREDWSGPQRRHLRLADELNRRVPPSAGYMVSFEVEHADRDPSPRRFAEFVKRELVALPPHEDVAARPFEAGSQLPHALYEENGIRITVRFMPMVADAKAKTDPDARIVGMGAAIGGAVNSGARLKDRLTAKAGAKYGIDGLPFLIVVGIHDPMCSDVQVLWALYGGESVEVPSGRVIRSNDGFFGVDKKRVSGRQRRVSAVATVQFDATLEPEDANIAVFHNPFPDRTWPQDAFSGSREFGLIEESEDFLRLDWI